MQITELEKWIEEFKKEAKGIISDLDSLLVTDVQKATEEDAHRNTVLTLSIQGIQKLLGMDSFKIGRSQTREDYLEDCWDKMRKDGGLTLTPEKLKGLGIEPVEYPPLPIEVKGISAGEAIRRLDERLRAVEAQFIHEADKCSDLGYKSYLHMMERTLARLDLLEKQLREEADGRKAWSYTSYQETIKNILHRLDAIEEGEVDENDEDSLSLKSLEKRLKEIYQDLVNIEIEHTNYLERPEWQAKNEEYLKVCREKSN